MQPEIYNNNSIRHFYRWAHSSNNNNCAFNDCYATGYVNGGNYKGGLVGQDFGSSAFTSCYYNSETSGQSDTGKGEPRTTNQDEACRYVRYNL
jgi:hypothetical protein